MVVDEMSPSYHYILPSIQRWTGNLSIASSRSTDVNVSTFNSSDLILSNDLTIYSFITGFDFDCGPSQDYTFLL
jgi:hypothetical protein